MSCDGWLPWEQIEGCLGVSAVGSHSGGRSALDCVGGGIPQHLRMVTEEGVVLGAVCRVRGRG